MKRESWNPGRNRGIKDLNERVGPVPTYIDKLLKIKPKIKILEIGTGYARALVELKKIYENKIETHGINLESDWDLNLVRKYNFSEGLITKTNEKKYLPKIHILDAGKKLPFKSNTFDLIFSQASTQYVHDKALFLEEINRLLTKNGIGLIELQELKSKHPVEYKNLFEIWKNGKQINSIKYLKTFKNIQAKKAKKLWHILEIKKTRNLKLNLELITSFDLNKIHSTWWGTKAIYVKK